MKPEALPPVAPTKRKSAPYIGVCGICGSDSICEHDKAFAAAALAQPSKQWVEWIEPWGVNDEPVSQELRDAIQTDVLSHIDDDDSGHEVFRAASDFQHGDFTFTDLWDHDFKDFTFRFQWCCYALAWGIQQYDQKQK